jgi:site-specific DNA recombinase
MSSALVYVRQSRHKAYERTVSPETQESACRALPAVQACQQVHVYRDLDVSGGKRGRRDYLAMLERIRTDGSVKVVAFYDPSRIARDNLLSAEFYALMEQHPDIAVALVEGGPFDRSPSGEFTWTVLGAAATHLRKETGVKIRASKQYAASQGQMVGQVPAGYRWQGEGRERHLVIDEDLATIVRRVFEEYATGRYSARDIARRLNVEGVVLPSFKGGWRMDTVSQMLGNPAYAGYTYLSRSRREGELIRGQWPAIVELDTWQAVQLLLQRRRIKHGGRRTESETRPYVFRGTRAAGGGCTPITSMGATTSTAAAATRPTRAAACCARTACFRGPRACCKRSTPTGHLTWSRPWTSDASSRCRTPRRRPWRSWTQPWHGWASGSSGATSMRRRTWPSTPG